MPQEQLPVFVYGTLRPGEKNHRRYLGGRTTRIVPAVARGELRFVSGEGYPCVTPGEGIVKGELIFLAPDRYEETLHRLDELEEYDEGSEEKSVYLRRRAAVTLPDGSSAEGWIYYWNRPQTVGERIESGDFKTRGQDA